MFCGKKQTKKITVWQEFDLLDVKILNVLSPNALSIPYIDLLIYSWSTNVCNDINRKEEVQDYMNILC